VTNKNVINFKNWFNATFPIYAFKVFLVYFIKPFVNSIIYRVRGITNQSHYAFEVFILRLTYDVFFIAPFCLYGFETASLTLKQFIALSVPCVLLELGLYFASVKPGNSKARKLHYRMVKVTVTSQ